MRVVLRLGVVLAASFVFLVVFAVPASAHTISGPRPTNFRSRVVSINPPAPGVDVRIVDLGSKLELTNHTPTEVLVLGYEGEPYLRVGPDGVHENLHSAATYINRSLKGGVVPAGVDTRPTAPPDWHKVSDGNTARWHDHRSHWMGGSLPPQVVSAPGSFHHISDGEITFVHDGVPSRVTVALDWVPGPSGLPWIPAIVLLFVGGFAVAFVSRWSRALAIVIGLLVVVDAAHAIAYEMARPGTTATLVVQFLTGTFVSIIVWIAAVPTIIGLWRRRVEALYGAIFVGVMVALVGGATDLSALWKSQLPPAGPDWLTRAVVVFALGVGGGVAIGALARLVISERKTRSEPDSGKWLSSLVVGLDEKELRRIATELDVDEVLGAALPDLAERLGPETAAFAAGALVLDVAADDATGPHTWSIGDRDGALVAEPGAREPVAGRVGVTFPLLLQLLAGTVTLDGARSSGRLNVAGDEQFVATVRPHLAEREAATPAHPSTDRAPAS